MPPAPVSESTAPRAIVFPAPFPALGVAVPVAVFLLQAERRRGQTTSSDPTLRPNFRSPPPPITRIVRPSKREFHTAVEDAPQRKQTRGVELEVRPATAVLAGRRLVARRPPGCGRLGARRPGRRLVRGCVAPALHRIAQVRTLAGLPCRERALAG